MAAPMNISLCLLQWWNRPPAAIVSVYFFFFYIYFIFITLLSLWDYSHGKFRLLSLEKASCDSPTTQSSAHTRCFSVSIIHWSLTCTTESLLCNVCTDVIDWDCTPGCTNTHERVCTESWLWEKNPLPHGGNQICGQQCASLMLYQLSNIPTLCYNRLNICW